MFSDKESVCPGIEQTIDITLRMNAAFHDEQPVVGNELGQAKRSIQGNVEGFEIAVIHADDRCSCFQCLTQLVFVVNLGQNIKLELMRKSDQLFQLAKVEHRGDQQDCARSSSTCLIDLEGLPNKVFSQHRQAGGRSDLVDPTEIALKKVFFRDDRHGTRAGFHIRASEIRRI